MRITGEEDGIWTITDVLALGVTTDRLVSLCQQKAECPGAETIGMVGGWQSSLLFVS